MSLSELLETHLAIIHGFPTNCSLKTRLAMDSINSLSHTLLCMLLLYSKKVTLTTCTSLILHRACISVYPCISNQEAEEGWIKSCSNYFTHTGWGYLPTVYCIFSRAKSKWALPMFLWKQWIAIQLHNSIQRHNMYHPRCPHAIQWISDR